jgi:hypothetical protein
MTGKMHTIGTRAQVWHGTAKKTSGGLLKSDLMMNKHGRIVSRAKHSTAKKEMRLLKHGYGTKKGKFGFVKMSKRGSRSRSRKMRGGSSLSPASVDDSYMIKDVVPQVFSPLDRALVGGRRHRRRSMAGGMVHSLNPADISSSDITGLSAGMPNFSNEGSVDVQIRAGMAGGRRYKRRSMRGGTMDRRMPGLMPTSPTMAALRA